MSQLSTWENVDGEKKNLCESMWMWQTANHSLTRKIVVAKIVSVYVALELVVVKVL